MKIMICEICGGHEIIKEDGVFVCRGCGTKYSVEEAKSLLADIDMTETEEEAGDENEDGIVNEPQNQSQTAV